MPSYAVSNRRTLVPLFALSLAVTLPLGAQASIGGTDINAAADSGRLRSPVLFGGAYTLPAGSRGVSFQQAKGTDFLRRDLYLLTPGPMTSYYREQYASTLSAYWGLRDWLTVGGSFGFATTTNRIYPSDGNVAAPPEQSFTRTASRFGDVHAFGRARLYRSRDGGTQVAANVAIGSSGAQGGPYGRSMDGSVGLALAQQVGPLSLHLAPSLQSEAGNHYAQLAGAIVFPLMPHVSASVEGIATGAQWGGYAMPGMRPLFDVGGGLRADFGHLKLDLGIRHATQPLHGEYDRDRTRLVIGTHVSF